MKNKTFTELVVMYQATIEKLERLDAKISDCWDNGDKSSAKSLECGMDQYLDTLYEIEQILDLREDF